MIRDLTFITGNPAKAKQLSEYLQISLLHQKIELPEIQSMDLKEIIQYKAIEAYRNIKSPVLVDDVSVSCTALRGLPGPFIKWFIEVMTPAEFCQMLKPYEDKSAVAIATFGLYDGRTLEIFEGIVKGRIADKPSGSSMYGFGWDSMFIPEGYDRTRGELSKDEYNATSPRLRAVRKLEDFLKKSGITNNV